MARKPETPSIWPVVEVDDVELIAETLRAFPLAAAAAQRRAARAEVAEGRQGTSSGGDSRRISLPASLERLDELVDVGDLGEFERQLAAMLGEEFDLGEIVPFGAAASPAPVMQAAGADMLDFLPTLDVTALSLLRQCVIRNGLARDEVSAPDVDSELVDRTAAQLQLAGFVTVEDGRLTIDDDIEDLIPLPFPLARLHLDMYTSDVLGLACRQLALVGGDRKDGRIAKLQAFFADPAAITAAIAKLSDEARHIFVQIIEASLSAAGEVSEGEFPGAVSIFDALEDPSVYRDRSYIASRSDQPYDQVAQRLLVGVSPWDAEVWAWLEVVEAIAPSSNFDVVAPRPVEPVPLDRGVDRPYAAVAAALAAVDAVAAAPLEGKKTGDRRPPVRALKALAAAIGLAHPAGELLFEVLVDLGVIVPCRLPATGRGRNQTEPVEWRVHPQCAAQLRQLDVVEQWSALVSTWLAARPASLNLSPDHTARALLVAALAGLPEGTGIPISALADWLADRYLIFAMIDDVDDRIAELFTMGLCPSGTTVGLTSVARAVLSGTDAAERSERVGAELDAPAEQVVIQPDHSIIAPPNLAPSVRSRLRRLAELESEGGATVWRLSTQLLTEVGATESADDVVAELRALCADALPDNVERLVRDTVGGSARLEVLEATTVVRCDDPATLADAARHRTAKLTVVAPGVATSTLAPAKLIDVLRGKGVAVTPTGELVAATGGGGAGARAGATGRSSGRRRSGGAGSSATGSTSDRSTGSAAEGDGPLPDEAASWVAPHPPSTGSLHIATTPPVLSDQIVALAERIAHPDGDGPTGDDSSGDRSATSSDS